MSSETVATDSSESTVTAESPLSLPQIPAQLAEELARIISRALVEDYRAELSNRSMDPSGSISRS